MTTSCGACADLQAQGVADRDKIANLEISLIAARRIGAAIGVLMVTRKVTEDGAFALLREASQKVHRKWPDPERLIQVE